jgi:hypothetical protein
MKIGPILRELKFGGDVAENDDNLDLYFVETSAFFDVIADEADLILGPKAAARRRSSEELRIPMLPFRNCPMLIFYRHLTFRVL